MQQDTNISDMLSIMMQMFGNSDENETDGQAAKMQQAMQMVQMFQMFSSLNPSADGGEHTVHAENTSQSSDTAQDAQPSPATNTAFYDTPILTPELIALKAAIPHIERKYQQPLGIMVKLIELQRLMLFYKSDAAMQSQSVQNAASAAHARNMLAAIRSNMPDEITRTKLDILAKTLDIAELLQQIPNHHT